MIRNALASTLRAAAPHTTLRAGSASFSALPRSVAASFASQRAFHVWQHKDNTVKHVPAEALPTGQYNPGIAPPVETLGVDAVLSGNLSSAKSPTPAIFTEFSLAGKTAVITGGNGGLGLEIALGYVEAGATVYALDIHDEPSAEFKAVARHCRDLLGQELHYISMDVTNQEDTWKTMEYISKESGRLDVLVAGAGVLQTHDALEYPKEEWDKLFAVNSTGVFLSAQGAAREMIKSPHIKGSIILIASMSGSVVNHSHRWAAYNSSKSAVLQMARNLAAEWGELGIRVNSLSPGHIRTKMTAKYLDANPELLNKWSNSNPLGRIGRSAEIRGVSIWLASQASSFCTGSDIIVSGGHQIW
ncbi:NAD(P)-binding protein [Tilletiaria anomala UBC 951]|uniref:NAD(P)-binding protein n=1 Tax=Tilletiaria anomala (strain ATCC 24038 / CBS 436.72 / UBC 951) TaxID=1037660 RepID=A0A066VL25_TILAU|nr:NAD(P)-binding protein [Tilletiaria anomala UBC 951]KDN42417.1 NAD(P)-binding protein [Tilletiaria anomala UBC 951]